MALVAGTNCGFVLAAPVADPGGTGGTADGFAIAFKDTSPVGADTVTEVGFWQNSVLNDPANFFAGVYTHDAGNNRPNVLLAGDASGSVTTEDTAQWEKYAGLTIDIDASTTYWVSTGCENVAATNQIDFTADAGEKYDYKASATGALPEPWGVSTGTFARLLSVYAVYTTGAPPAGDTRGGAGRGVLHLLGGPFIIGGFLVRLFQNPLWDRREWLRRLLRLFY